METRAQALRKLVIPHLRFERRAEPATRAQALRKPVIPAKAGIHFNPKALDSRFRGNDGLKETI